MNFEDKLLTKKEINEKILNMDNSEIGRWLSLIEAINLIETECSYRKEKKESLKTKPIQKYIEATNSIYLKQLDEMGAF